MTGYCISDQYCRYKSDTGYCGYTTGGCVRDNAKTITLPINDLNHQVRQEVYITTESIEAIAEAVVKKLKGGQS